MTQWILLDFAESFCVFSCELDSSGRSLRSNILQGLTDYADIIMMVIFNLYFRTSYRRVKIRDLLPTCQLLIHIC